MPAKKITRTDRITRRLKSAQAEKGLTQERVAKKMGVGTSTVSYWYRDINRLGVLQALWDKIISFIN